MVNRNTEHADFSANLSLPVPKRTLIQLSFCGVPKISKSYEADSLEIASIESLDFTISILQLDFVSVNNSLEDFLICSNSSFSMVSETTRNNVNDAQ